MSKLKPNAEKTVGATPMKLRPFDGGGNKIWLADSNWLPVNQRLEIGV
jgi:hypothetical protein